MNMSVLEYFRELELKEVGERKYKRIEVGKKSDLEVGKVYILNEQEFQEIQEVMKHCKVNDEKLQLKDDEHKKAIMELGLSHDKVVDGYKDQIKILENTHENRTRELSDKYESRIDEMENKYQNRIETLENTHKSVIEDLENAYETKVKELEDKYQSRIERLENKYDERTKKLEDKYESKVKELKDENETNLQELEIKYDNKTKENEYKYDLNIKALENKYESKISELMIEIDEIKESKTNDRIRFNNTLIKLNSMGFIDVIRNKHKKIIDDSKLLVESKAIDGEYQ